MFSTQEFENLGFGFGVNLSDLRFFSSKITIKALREEASFLMKNIISPNSSAEKIVERAQAQPWQTSVTRNKSLTLSFSSSYKMERSGFFQTTEKLKGEKKKIKWGDIYKFKITSSFWGKKVKNSFQVLFYFCGIF